ncbi:hypothetical protein Hsar01_00124 [Haloferula sargassicola]|uniref:Uncharacterized protein n=2 Tax=Haloferula sargassicola TaxID=490096 RepID=A0ABP9UHD6_9BACT
MAFWCGYHGERRVMDGAGKPRNPVKSVVRRLTMPEHERAGLEELEKLRQAIGRKRLSALETAALWKMVRGFSAAEAEAALEEVLAANSEREVDALLVRMLSYRWGELAPDLALAKVKTLDGRIQYLLKSAVLDAWGSVDPDAMRHWVRDQGDEQMTRTAAILSAREWCRIDPENALAKAREEFPEAVSWVVSELAHKAGRNERARAALISALAEDKALWKDSRSWLGSLSQSPGLDGAMVKSLVSDLEAAGADEGQIAHFRSSWEWWGKYVEGQSGEVSFDPEPLNRSAETASGEEMAARYRAQAMEWPDAAIEWAKSHGNGDLISGLAKSRTDQFLRSGWMPDPRHAFPEQTALLKHIAAWKRDDPRAVGEWLNTLPSDMATFLQTPTPDQ